MTKIIGVKRIEAYQDILTKRKREKIEEVMKKRRELEEKITEEEVIDRLGLSEEYKALIINIKYMEKLAEELNPLFNETEELSNKIAKTKNANYNPYRRGKNQIVNLSSSGLSIENYENKDGKIFGPPPVHSSMCKYNDAVKEILKEKHNFDWEEKIKEIDKKCERISDDLWLTGELESIKELMSSIEKIKI